MKKIVVCWGLGVLCLAFSSFSFAAIEGEGGNVPEYMKVFQKSSPADPNKNPFQDFEMPDWAKRFWFGGSYGTDTAESIYLETVQPLYWAGDGKGVIFTHDRISKFDEHGSYSAGLGYRKIVDRLHAIAGVNAFLDYQSHLNHARLGYGVELIGNRLEFRTNFYTGLTGQRDTGLGTGSVTYFQEVVDGFDTEIGTPVPYLPWMKIFGGYQWYDYKHRGDFCGWTSRLEMTLKKAAVLNLNIFDDEDHGDVGVEVDLRFRLVFEDMKSLLTLNDVEWMSSTPKTEINLEDRLLDRVEREFEIRVESWKEGESSGGVSVGNLTNVVLQVNRLPGTSMTGGLDADNIGYADAGDGFEIDFQLTAGSSGATGVSFANAVVSTGWSFAHNTSANLGNVGANSTVITDSGSDLDLVIPGGTADGTTFNITMDITSDGETTSATFGPFIVGGSGTGNITVGSEFSAI